MAHKTLIGGTAYEITGGKTLIGGTGYSIKGGKTLVGGTGYDIPFVKRVSLGSLAAGSVVYIKESGSLVPFYVACHNYESSKNGTGRTLMVRKDVHSIRSWHSSNLNYQYKVTAINTWLNGTYKSSFDSAVQSAMGSTTIRVTNGIMEDYSCSIFLLSAYEILGYTPASANKEGSPLPTGDAIRIAYFNGSAHPYWTRSPKTDNSMDVYNIDERGYTQYYYANRTSGVRPCFTLPETTLFNAETKEFLSA